MVESVDTRDLKSLGYCGCAGSSPASSTRVILYRLQIKMLQAFFFLLLKLFRGSPNVSSSWNLKTLLWDFPANTVCQMIVDKT